MVFDLNAWGFKFFREQMSSGPEPDGLVLGSGKLTFSNALKSFHVLAQQVARNTRDSRDSGGQRKSGAMADIARITATHSFGELPKFKDSPLKKMNSRGFM